MKTNRLYPTITQTSGRPRFTMFNARLNNSSAIQSAIARSKEEVFRQYGAAFPGQERLLKLALNEAEAVAWQTEYPHLVFPELALEKAQTAVAWQKRQKLIYGNQETAFAA